MAAIHENEDIDNPEMGGKIMILIGLDLGLTSALLKAALEEHYGNVDEAAIALMEESKSRQSPATTWSATNYNTSACEKSPFGNGFSTGPSSLITTGQKPGSIFRPTPPSAPPRRSLFANSLRLEKSDAKLYFRFMRIWTKFVKP